MRAAIALAGFVACPHCGPVELAPDEERECTRICHPFADCPYVLHPDSDAAADLAWLVDEELGEILQDGVTVLAGIEPVNAWGMA